MAPSRWRVWKSPSTGIDAITEFALREHNVEFAGEMAVLLDRGAFEADDWSRKVHKRTLRVIWVFTRESRYGAVYRAPGLLQRQAQDVILVIFKSEDQSVKEVPAWVVDEAGERLWR